LTLRGDLLRPKQFGLSAGLHSQFVTQLIGLGGMRVDAVTAETAKAARPRSVRDAKARSQRMSQIDLAAIALWYRFAAWLILLGSTLAPLAAQAP